jgi:hypothetical protein
VPAWQDLLDGGYLHPLRTEKADMEDFVSNPNSGKLIRFVNDGRETQKKKMRFFHFIMYVKIKNIIFDAWINRALSSMMA